MTMGKQRFPIPKQPILSTLNQHLIDHLTLFPSIILMFIAVHSFGAFDPGIALCLPLSEEGPEVSSGGSLGALMRSPEAPSLDWDELLQGRSLNPDQGTGGVGSPTPGDTVSGSAVGSSNPPQGTGRVGSATPGDTVSGSAVEGGAAAASASTPHHEGLIRLPLADGSYFNYLGWAHLFPEDVQPSHQGAAPWLPAYRVAHDITIARDIQETLGCICCPKASCPLWKPGGWGALHHHPLPGDLSPGQYAYFWQNFPQPKYYVED